MLEASNTVLHDCNPLDKLLCWNFVALRHNNLPCDIVALQIRNHPYCHYVVTIASGLQQIWSSSGSFPSKVVQIKKALGLESAGCLSIGRF